MILSSCFNLSTVNKCAFHGLFSITFYSFLHFVISVRDSAVWNDLKPKAKVLSNVPRRRPLEKMLVSGIINAYIKHHSGMS